MAVPRSRLSNARKNSRRAHHAKKAKNLFSCSNCGELKLPHVLCESCGFYKDRVVVEFEEQEQ